MDEQAPATPLEKAEAYKAGLLEELRGYEAQLAGAVNEYAEKFAQRGIADVKAELERIGVEIETHTPKPDEAAGEAEATTETKPKRGAKKDAQEPATA